MTIAERAQKRFDDLRVKALSSITFDEKSVQPPTGWCISAIARLKVNDSSLIDRVEELQKMLTPIADLYMYPAVSLHLSLLGCTQREPTPQTETPGRIAAIREAVQSTVDDHGPVRMDIGRVNLLGTQFFLEVVTNQEDWSRMRKELETRLRAIGESPIAYEDTEPVHLNTARVLSAPNQALAREALQDTSFAVNRSLIINSVELVLTDFVVSPENLRVLDTFRLR